MRTFGLLLTLVALVASGCFGGGDDEAASRTGTVAGTAATTTTGSGAGTTTSTVPRAAEDPEWPDEPAGEFILRVNRQLVAGEADEAWATLHPWHQVVAPEGRFVSCYRRALDDVPEDLVSLERGSVREVEAEILGRGRTVPAKEVVVRYELPLGLDGDRETFHAVVVDGEWRWLLPEYYYRAFLRGSCPSA